MELLAILAAVLAAVVFVAERVAFAVLLYFLTSWALRVTYPVRARLWAGFLVVRGQIRLWVWAVRHWYATWLLRKQLAAGATP